MVEVDFLKDKVLKDLFENNYHSSGLQAGVEYGVRILLKQKLNQADLAFKYRVSEVTVRNNFHKMLDKIEKENYKLEV